MLVLLLLLAGKKTNLDESSQIQSFQLPLTLMLR